MLIYFATRLFSTSKNTLPAGTPEVVVVTLLDDATMSDEYRERIMENRRYYASKHGTYQGNSFILNPIEDSGQATLHFFP